MTRPVIGICAALERARYGVWDQPTDLVPRGYVAAVERAGATAIILPVQASLIDNPEPVLDRIDALMLSGGADVDPSSYGAEPHPQTLGTSPQRDTVEIALVRGAMRREMPVLGICRGMQIINVALGGTLEQHIPDIVASEAHRATPGAFSDHEVRLDPGSLAARSARDLFAIKSHHHQAVDKLGEGLTVTGWSVPDDLPEALEAPEHEYVLGVQWHPEADPGSHIVQSLVDEARARAG